MVEVEGPTWSLELVPRKYILRKFPFLVTWPGLTSTLSVTPRTSVTNVCHPSLHPTASHSCSSFLPSLEMGEEGEVESILLKQADILLIV